jgi:hypothetical protein
MALSPVTPVRLTRDQHLHGTAEIDLTKGFTLVSTMFLRPQRVAEEQVIFDIGSSGSSPDRVQFFIDVNGELVFRVNGNALRIPAAAVESLTQRWVPMTIQAKLRGKKLLLRLSTIDFEWSDESQFNGPANYGLQMRIGQALSGGRGMALEMLDVMAIDALMTKAKAKRLMNALAERPSAFDIEHGLQ